MARLSDRPNPRVKRSSTNLAMSVCMVAMLAACGGGGGGGGAVTPSTPVNQAPATSLSHSPPTGSLELVEDFEERKGGV